jgi:ATP-binding cassette subfamily B protein
MSQAAAPGGEGDDRARPASPKGTLNEARGWLGAFVRPHLGRLAVVFALSVAASGVALAQPYVIKILIDDGLVARSFRVVAIMCAILLAAALIGAALSALNRWHYVTASGRILFALRESVYRHLQTLSPGFYARMHGGDVMARLDGDLAEVQRFAVDSALAFLNGVIVLVGALALMLSLSWKLSLIAFAVLPVQIVLLRFLRPRVETETRDLRSQASGISSFLFDTLSAMKFIQSVGAQDREADRLAGLQDGYFLRLRRLQMLNLATTTLPGLLTLVGTVLVFLAGGAMVVAGTLTLGTLVAFTAYLARASGPVHTLLGLWVALKRAQVSLDRVREITDERPAVTAPAEPEPLPGDAAGAIAIEDVTFRYPEQDDAVLKGAAAALPAGAKVAVVGASGAGKTTLIDLLQRHYDPAAGRILIDGVDLRALDLAILRRRVAVVAQDTVLLPGSIADNIRYAAPEADDAAVRQAARLAGADAFIAAQPDGYATQVGPRGTKLSGGQRQRIAIARAVLQDPLILVLDEATSGVDTEAERAIGQAIDTLFAKRTRIVIGHRSTLPSDADTVFDLAKGKLVQRPAKPKTAARR